MNYSCSKQQHEWILENVIVNENRQTGVQSSNIFSFTESHLQDLMFYTEHQGRLPILNDKEEMNSFLVTIASSLLCILEMLQLHNGKNPETWEHSCGSCVSRAYVISMNN